MDSVSSLPASDPAGLVVQLLAAVREESDALKAGDAVKMAAAESRKRHLLRQLAPWNSGTPPAGT